MNAANRRALIPMEDDTLEQMNRLMSRRVHLFGYQEKVLHGLIYEKLEV